jgi:hypothetical protein
VAWLASTSRFASLASLVAGMRTRLNAKHKSSAGIRSNGLEIAGLRMGTSATWPNGPRSMAGFSASSSVLTTDSTWESPMNVMSHGCGKNHYLFPRSAASNAANRLR